MLSQVKTFFVNEVNEFWENSDHVSARKDAAVIGKLFGKFLHPHSSFDSEKDGYIFSIEEQDMKFCLNSLCKIFGLGQEAHTATKTILRNNKTIGLSLL